MNKKIMLVDIDGVLNDFQNHFLEYVEKLGYKYDVSKTSYYELHYSIKHKDAKKIRNFIFSLDNFWETLPLLDFAPQGLEYLNDKFDTYIATAPWDEKNKNQKIDWIKNYFPFFDLRRIIFSDKKWELKGNFIIEDRPETIKKCIENDIISIAKFHPYTMNLDVPYFLYSWRDITNVIASIENSMEVQE